MTKIKKTAILMATILVIMSVLASCGSNQSAADASGTSGTLTWRYESSAKTLTVSGGGDMTNFSASSDPEWKNVRSSAQNIVIESGVTSIGDYAFYYFSALKSVSMSQSVGKIGKCAFAFCSSLEIISLHDGITSLGESAFEGCAKLKGIFVPASVTSIGARTFAYCASMENATVLGCAESGIPSLTFKNCLALKGVTFGSGMSDDRISVDAFDGCTAKPQMNYTDSATGKATLTIKYVYADGSQASEPVVRENLEFGSAYTENSPTIDGYTADKLTVSGSIYGKDLEITVTYNANAPVETEPESTETPEPQSKMTSVVAIIILVVVLAGIGVAAFFIIRADKKNTSRQGKNVKNSKKK